MKKIILIILLLTVSLFATDRYLTLNGAGNQSGSSWTNADSWNSISFWGSCTGGDRIFVSGGVDSVVYTTGLDVVASGTWGHYLEILPGKYSPSPSGHSGKVIIDLNFAGGNGVTLGNVGLTREWIKVKGLEVRHTGAHCVSIACNANYIWVDSCVIHESGTDFGVVEVNGWCPQYPDFTLSDTTAYPDHIQISNNRIWTNKSRAIAEDVILVQVAADVRIHHNYLHQQNDQVGGTGHIDCIQTANAVAGTKIYNNIAIVDSQINGHCFILGEVSRGNIYRDTLLVANNYLYNGGTSSSGNDRGVLLWRGSEEYDVYRPVTIGVHNTIVVANNTCWNSKSDAYNPVEHNNLYVQMGVNGSTPSSYGVHMQESANAGYFRDKFIDSCKSNLLWRNFPPYDVSIGGGWRPSGGGAKVGITSWSDWLSHGGTGVNANPKLKGNYRTGDLKGELDPTSPAIDAGFPVNYLNNLFGYLPGFDITKDIRGNPRSAIPDIGAYEYGAAGPDTTVSVTFTAITGAELGSYHIGKARISGDADATFHTWAKTSVDTFKINYNGTKTVGMVTTVIGDTIYSYNVASNLNSIKTTNSVMVAGIQRNFDVTTKDVGGGVTVGGGWARGSNNRKIYLSNGRSLRTKQP